MTERQLTLRKKRATGKKKRTKRRASEREKESERLSRKEKVKRAAEQVSLKVEKDLQSARPPGASQIMARSKTSQN